MGHLARLRYPMCGQLAIKTSAGSDLLQSPQLYPHFLLELSPNHLLNTSLAPLEASRSMEGAPAVSLL